jgi:glycosyltransferase involved in cell wall biosynthesis
VLYANQSAREVLFYDYPFPLSLIAFLVEPFQYRNYKNVKTVCYSQSIKDDLVSFGVPSHNISVFPLGIDHERYVVGMKSSEPTFIFVSRFVKYKRADICIKAMKSVVKKYPKVKLYLIGYGKEEENLNDLITKLNLRRNVFIVNKNNIFFEKNHKDAKVALMQKAWALILPSVKEGWGMVVTEAAASSTPAIVSNVTGLRDAVIDNKTGMVLSRNPKPEELAKAMALMIADSDLRKKLSLGALEWSKNFTWEKSYKSFLKLITP